MPSVNPTKKSAVEKEVAAQMMGDNLTKVLGDAGTESYSGFFMEEYKHEWRDESRITLVEEMRRGDATARAGLRAIKSPLLSTKWSISTEDLSDKGEEIRLFVEQNLFGMKRSWKKFLREALGYLDFGHYVFEEIWEIRDGKVWLKDLAPRIPHSIFRWKTSTGEFGIQQIIRNDNKLEVQGSFVEIPAGKLLILTNDMEGDDVTGQSVLRSAWKHWNLKQVLYKIQGIAAERFGVGIPVITMDGKAGAAEKEEAEDWGKAVKSNQKAYVVLPNKDWDVKILTPNGNPQSEAIISAIEHHDKAMLHALLAAFIMLGSGSGGGSYNLGENLLYFFFKACEDMADYFKEEIDGQVIKRLVELNFGAQEIYPKLNYAPLGEMDQQELSVVLKTLSDAGLLYKDGRLLEHVHNAFKLPPIPDEVLEDMKEEDLNKEVDQVDDKAEDEDPNPKEVKDDDEENQ